MIIGMDVDLTVVDALTNWFKWYKFKTGHDLFHIMEAGEDHGFNVQELMINHSSPLDYWKQEDLYDTLEPLPGCVEKINQMKEAGHEIIFISYCFAGHLDSKVSFLKRFFGSDIVFIDTKHKEYVQMDAMFDDHSTFLEKIKDRQPDCLLIQKKTSINSILETAHSSFENWEDFNIEVLNGN